MKHVVIIGGGFAGLTAARQLDRNLGRAAEIDITLIDRESYHLYPPNLYELCTTEEELASLTDLKHSVTVPLAAALAGTRVKYFQGEVTAINAAKSELAVGAATIAYDYLIVAQGSTSNFYGIPGVEQYSLPMKTVNDALMIRDRIEFAVQAHRYDVSKQYIRIAVAGGGFAGVELSAELQKFLDIVAWKNNFPRAKIETLLIEGTDRLLPGLDARVARDIYIRLRDLGVRIQVSSFVAKAEAQFLEFKNGERLEYDCLIWTAGVKASSAPFSESVAADRAGRILVDELLRPKNLANVFVIGDQACVLDRTGQPVPGNISHARDQAGYVAAAIIKLMSDRAPRTFVCKEFGYIIPVGGKWAVFKTRRLYIKGWLAYVIREFAGWRWFAFLVGWRKALRLVWFDEKIYSMND